MVRGELMKGELIFSNVVGISSYPNVLFDLEL
jgi:hypothetical protein